MRCEPLHSAPCGVFVRLLFLGRKCVIGSKAAWSTGERQDTQHVSVPGRCDVDALYRYLGHMGGAHDASSGSPHTLVLWTIIVVIIVEGTGSTPV